MDGALSEFVVRTSADPGLARDLLNAHGWNLQSALSAFYVMKGLLPGEVPSRRDSFASKTHLLPLIQPTCSSTSKESSKINDSMIGHNVKINKDKKNISDETCCKKLTRGFSRANDNLNLISQARTEFAQDFDSLSQESRCPSSRLEIPDYTFTLPNISAYPPPLQKYLQQDLIEMATLVSLKQAGRLNWWYQKNICQELWPLATTGDGNCLLHAASLGIWGFHDRLLTLRKALHNLLTSSVYTNAFYRRWRWQTAMQNKESGLIYSEEEWGHEWENLLKISSTEPRTKHAEFKTGSAGSSCGARTQQKSYGEKLSDVYESLEELHVFVLAHVLRRPVIVIADTMLRDMKGEPFAPIPFGGIYLPLELSPSECHRSPLCLAYDAAHFSALVPMDSIRDKCNEILENGETTLKKLPTAVPVTDPDNRLLHLHFAIDPGSEVKWGRDENDVSTVSRLSLEEEDKLLLLHDYLDIRTFPVPVADGNGETKTSKNVTKNGFSTELEYDSDNSLTGSGISCTGSKTHKSKAARQLQTVAKQFGSIGKSVSKKLKHIGEIARHRSFKGEARAFKLISSNNREKRIADGSSMVSCTFISNLASSNQAVIALLHTSRQHEYKKQMINNYLNSVIIRFEKEKEPKINNFSGNSRTLSPTKCLSCGLYGNFPNDDLCKNCFEKCQKELDFLKRVGSSHHNSKNFADCPVFTFGKSSFYTEIKDAAPESVHKLPRQLSEKSIIRWDGANYCGKPAINGVYPSTFNRVTVRL